MKILVFGDHQYAWYAKACGRGLRELGHQVIEYDPTEFWSPGLLGRVERRFVAGLAILRINSHLLRQVNALRPDIVFLYAPVCVWPSTIGKLKQIAWVTAYHNDDPFGQFGKRCYFRLFRKCIPVFDSMHVFRSINIEECRTLGATRVGLLMGWYVPWIHLSTEPIDQEKTTAQGGIIFVGHPEWDSRVDYLRALIRAKLPLRVYGPRFEEWLKILGATRQASEVIRPVFGQEYVEIIRRAKISLAFFSKGNRDDYTTRVFEIPAAGGFLMAKRTEAMKRLYIEGVEAEFFDSPDELTDKCKYYLSHHQARQAIANAGQLRCLRSGYDVLSRMHQWLEDIQGWTDRDSN